VEAGARLLRRQPDRPYRHPDKRTFGFFNENIVAEYTYEQSVADGVNVGYDVPPSKPRSPRKAPR
jgi:type I site-specific restriction endonuclease